MAVVDLVMPKLGESIMEATILKWHKKSGDQVKMDETVLEIATDKVDSEVPSTAEGIIEETFFQVNDVVPIGTVIARIKTEAENNTAGTPSQVGAPGTSYKMHEPSPFVEAEDSEVVSTVTNNSNRSILNGNRFYSPLVLNIAASEGVSMTELEKIPGTGNEGRVTKKDILQYISDKKADGYRLPPHNDKQGKSLLMTGFTRIVGQRPGKILCLRCIAVMSRSLKWIVCAN